MEAHQIPSVRWYSAPLVHLDRHFTKRFMAERKGVHSSYCNSEPPILFAAVILPTVENVRSSKKSCAIIACKWDLRGQGRFVALVKNTITDRQGGGRTWPGWFLSSTWGACSSFLQLYTDVLIDIIGSNTGNYPVRRGVLITYYVSTNTECLAQDVLQEKYPVSRK